MKVLCITIYFIITSSSLFSQNIFRTACQGNIPRLDSMLVDKPINTIDQRGRTLLHWAVGCNQQEVFAYLIDKSIDVSISDNQQQTALHIAIQYNRSSLFNDLISMQSDEEWKTKHAGSLNEVAVMNNRPELLKGLFEQGVNIDSPNDRGSTPIELAQRIGNDSIYNLLIQLGANEDLIRDINPTGKYMGQQPPGMKGELFAPNFISTEEEEFGSIFNRDVTEFYFGVHKNGKSEIRFSKLVKNKWTKPITILSHEIFGYNDPFLSNDESKLYFISDQSVDGSDEKKDIDIWYVEREKNGWSQPVNTGNNINTSGEEYYISFTDKGTMYFSSDGHQKSKNEDQKHDIYFSEAASDGFQKPIKLGDAINSDSYEADVFIAPDETYIIYCSTREGGLGQGDLYISFKDETGKWSQAINMGDAVNSENYEYCPFVSKDGKYLFYTSNQDIYWISTEIIQALRKK